MLAKATPKHTCFHKLFKIVLVCKYKHTDLSLLFANSLFYLIKILHSNDIYNMYSTVFW